MPYAVVVALVLVVVVAAVLVVPRVARWPVTRRTDTGIVLLGLLLLVEAFVLFHLVVETWPAVEHATARAAQGTAGPPAPPRPPYVVELFGSVKWSLSGDSALLVMVLAMGALGAHLHATTSFTLHLAWRDFGSWWLWWYVLRPFVGAGLAAVFYFVVRGGLLSVSTQAADVNAYGLAAFAALAGLFSTPAMKRLEAIFNSALGGTTSDQADGPVATTADPDSVEVGAEGTEVEIRGSGFAEGAYADVEGRPHDLTWIDATRVRVTLTDEDVAEAGVLRVSVVNPDRKRSHDVRVEVTEPDA